MTDLPFLKQLHFRRVLKYRINYSVPELLACLSAYFLLVFHFFDSTSKITWIFAEFQAKDEAGSRRYRDTRKTPRFAQAGFRKMHKTENETSAVKKYWCVLCRVTVFCVIVFVNFSKIQLTNTEFKQQKC